jgi:hypothetical protein
MPLVHWELHRLARRYTCLLDGAVVGGGVLNESQTRYARKTLAASHISSDIDPARPETAGRPTQTDVNPVSG